MLAHRTSALRRDLRVAVRRTVVTASLGLTLIASAVVLATLTRVSLWWLPLVGGTIAFGAGLALVPRVRRLKSELVSVEQRARRMARDVGPRRAAVVP